MVVVGIAFLLVGIVFGAIALVCLLETRWLISFLCAVISGLCIFTVCTDYHTTQTKYIGHGIVMVVKNSPPVSIVEINCEKFNCNGYVPNARYVNVYQHTTGIFGVVSYSCEGDYPHENGTVE